MVSKIGHENRDENGDLTDLTNTNCDLKKKSWELMGFNQQTLWFNQESWDFIGTYSWCMIAMFLNINPISRLGLLYVWL